MSTNPYFTQYHTQRFSFIGSPQQRDGTALKDQRFLNMYPELIKSPISDGKKYYLKKRPGVSIFQTPTGATGVGRGIFYWQKYGTYLYVIGNTLYANAVSIATLTTSTGPVGFTEFLTGSADYIVLVDGIKGYSISSGNVVTQITDPNFPSPHIPNPIFFDGYLFLAASNTQTIHNSTLLNATTWPTDGFIDAELFPDNLVGLVKAQNYIAAVGTASIEYFYDNANATGSPLQRNAPAVTQLGCVATSTIVMTEKQFVLVGTTSSGGRTVWLIDGFQPTELATEPVREALDQEGSNLTQATAFSVQSAGHKWYILNLKGNQRTFVYDFEEQMWHEWSSGTGTACFNFDYATDGSAGNPILLSINVPSNTYSLTPSNTQDNGIAINCTVITSKIDFDTIKRKRFFRLSLIGDSPNGNITTPISISWSDDDYNTWVTDVILNINGSYPTITQLGISRRRAFRFIFQQPYPLRLEAFEVDIIQEVRR